MRYRIAADAFEMGETALGEIPLRVISSNRMLFLPETARAILDSAGEWIDFDTLTGASRDDYLDALTALEAFGLAEVVRDAAADTRGCRVAGERDYAAIARFMRGNRASPYGFAPVAGDIYYDDSNVRARQFNNKEYNFLYERGGTLQAVLVVGVPAFDQVLTVAAVQAAVFDMSLCEEERKLRLNDLMSFARDAFRGEFTKFRFCYTDPSQTWLRDALVEMGFTLTCTLEREIINSVDLLLYDCFC